MRSFLFTAIVLALIGCSSNPSQVGSSLPTTSVPDFNDLELGAPIEHESLVLVPVSTKKQDQSFDDYVTLAQAKENSWIEIIEVPGQETVDTLKVRYTGTKPMILFAGELLLGGKQDRVVGKDTIIKPGETVDVMVFCVEQGRWDGQSMHFDAQDAQVPLNVKEQAIAGDQQEVWESVGAYNKSAGFSMGAPVGGSSLKGGYRAVTNSKEYNEALEKAMKELKGRKDVVGVVIVLGGRVHSFEYFMSPRLFTSSSESVLRGAFASAMIEKGKGKTPPMSEIADFVSRSLKGARDRTFTAGETNAKLDLAATAGVSGAVSNQPDDGLVIHGSFYEKKK